MKTMTTAIARGRKGAALLLLVAFAVMDHAHGQANQTYTSFYDAISKIADYATLKTVVETANLVTVLSNPNLTAILLAPDNAAFQATLAAFPGAGALVSNQSALQAVLSYHVLNQTTPNAQLNLSNSFTGTTLPTLLLSPPSPPGTLANVTFKAMPGNQFYVGGLPAGALVNISNSVSAGKGRIYTLTTGILVPPSKTLTLNSSATVSLTIAELLQNTPGFTNLTALVLADPVLTAFATNPDNAVTVFAPPDSAITAFLQSQGLTLDGIKNSSVAQRIVLNHIVPLRPFTSSQLLPPNTTGNTAPPLPTASPGDLLRVTVSGSNVTVQGAGNTSPISVIAAAANIPAGKSVVHAIAGVIQPNTSASAGPPGTMAPPGPNTLPGALTPPGAMAPIPNTTPPGAMAPPPSTTPPGSSAPPPPPVAASMTIVSTWLLTTLLGAAMLLGFINM